MPTPRFAIYYADGSVYEGGGPEDELVRVTREYSRDWMSAPQDRVVGVIVESPSRHVFSGRVGDRVRGKELLGVEWYYPLEDGEYGFSDDIGAWLRKMGGVVKRGEYVSAAIMAEFWDWANNKYKRIPRR